MDRFVAGTRMAFISVQADEAEYYTKIESKQEQTKLAQGLPNVGDSSKSNKREAETVARLIHTLCQLYSRSGIPFSPCKQIGIIVPFRAQIAMIRKALAERHIPDTADITIDTVERYQGSQRDIIIFSTTVSRPYQLSILSEPVMTDGREIDRKLNVALTRHASNFHDRKRNAAPELHGLPEVSGFLKQRANPTSVKTSNYKMAKSQFPMVRDSFIRPPLGCPR